jgi:predicted transcriptional regulator
MDKDIVTLMREISDESCWSQSRIARELGIAQATVNRLMRGQLDCKASTLIAIKALHQSLTRRRRRSDHRTNP